MLSLTIFVSFLIYSVSGAGQLIILQAPKSIEFSGSDEIDAQTIPEVFTASLGFTVRKPSSWPGISVKDPFGFAESLVVVAVEGVSSIGDFDQLPVFPISGNEDEARSWLDVQEEVNERFPLISSKSLVRLELGSEFDSEDFEKVSHSKKKIIEEAYFLQELDELRKFTEDFKQSKITLDGVPDVSWVVFSSLHPLSDVLGETSDATLEAKQSVRKALIDLGQAVSRVTNGKSLVAAIVSDSSHTRHSRAAGDAAANNTAPGNRATIYSEEYPAIFNIILWFAVAFIFALIATSYFIASMDPGRDSIIYRMTSNRMKKDS